MEIISEEYLVFLTYLSNQKPLSHDEIIDHFGFRDSDFTFLDKNKYIEPYSYGYWGIAPKGKNYLEYNKQNIKGLAENKKQIERNFKVGLAGLIIAGITFLGGIIVGLLSIFL